MEKLKKWRSERSLSIDEAGSLVGVSGVQWHRYETGARMMPPKRVPVISKVTGISPRELRPDVFAIVEDAA